MRTKIIIVLASCIIFSSCTSKLSQLDYNQSATSSNVERSIELLTKLKKGENADAIINYFKETTQENLSKDLQSDAEKYAFWINIYNAYILAILKDNPEYYEDRRKFFKRPLVEIAGRTMSFAEIEHGIIRRSQKEYFLGYVGHLFPPSYQKALRPDKRDYRVHFALNCGAKGCPPVAVLTPTDLNNQLDMLTDQFLRQVTTYDKNTNSAETTPLFSWFRGDFGGKKGVKKILEAKGLIPDTKVGLEFGPYDWTLDLDNFVD